MGAGPGPGMMHMPPTGSVGPMGGAPRMSSGPPPSAFPRPPSFSTPGPPHAAGVGFAPGPSSTSTATHQPSGGGGGGAISGATSPLGLPRKDALLLTKFLGAASPLAQATATHTMVRAIVAAHTIRPAAVELMWLPK